MFKIFNKNEISLLSLIYSLAILSGIVICLCNGCYGCGIVTLIFIISIILSCIFSNINKRINKCIKKDNKTDEISKEKLNGLNKRFNSLLLNKLQVIPIFTGQLKSVIDQTDEAAGGLIEAFMAISRQAKTQLKSVKGVFGELSEQSSENNFLCQTRENLQKIQTNFLTLTSFFNNSINLISDVLDQLGRVDCFVSNIVNIAKTTNILAINAYIEAAHSGNNGLGFKVVASELSDLSKKSNQSIKEIAGITTDLKSKVNIIKQEIQSVQQRSIDISTSTDALFSQTTHKISQTLQDTAEKINVIAGDAENLSKEISRVVVSIQFQDITRQKIEHVITPLEMMNKELASAIDSMANGKDITTINLEENFKDVLINQYTMESEREILNKFDKSEFLKKD